MMSDKEREAEDEIEYDYDDAPGIGCCDCDDGWKHGCCDDLCYGCNDPVDCDNAIPCRHCNPTGELPW